jgi:hypothetical protein
MANEMANGDHMTTGKQAAETARFLSDALAQTIATVTDSWDEPLDGVHDIPQIVNAILAAGWQLPHYREEWKP